MAYSANSNRVIEVQKKENFAVIFIKNPPYNVLSTQVFEELYVALNDLQNDKAVQMVAITGQGIFSVGADVNQIWYIASNGTKQSIKTLLEKANAITNMITNLGKPTVAVIDGPCLGGGNELAMACTVRIATEQAQFGQPEINLGIMPGMGGTQRLPRLIGFDRALAMLVLGANISAKDAKDWGLVDELIDKKNLLSWIGEAASRIKIDGDQAFLTLSWHSRHSCFKVPYNWGETILETENFKRIAATKSPEAVEAIVNAVKFGVGHTLDESLKEEQRLFAELVMTESARNSLAKFLKINRPETKQEISSGGPQPQEQKDAAGSEDLRSLRKEVRDFAKKEIEPRIKKMEEEENVPMELVRKMAELGFFGVCYDEKYGGSGFGKTGYCIVTEELSRVHGSTALLVGAHVSLACGAVNIGGNEEQKMRYLVPAIAGEMIGAFALTESNAGSDAAGVETMAEKKGTHWIINGSKQFITNGDFADFVVVIAQTDKLLGEKGLTAFIIETKWPGFSVGRHEDKTGLRASHTVQLFFENVEVPEENLMGRVGEGFKIAMKTLNGGRLGLGAGCVGAAKGAYDLAFKYAGERRQFGQPINMFQANQFRLAKMAAEIYFMENTVYHAAAEIDAGQDLRMEVAMIKFLCSEMTWEIIDSAVQVFGGYGLIKDYGIERFWRDVRYNRIFEGTNEIQQLLIFKELIKSGGILRDYAF